MLSAAHRLRASADFTRVVRQGRRAGRPTLALHLLRTDESSPARVGFVVSKSVGGSVGRHRVSRRLRHLIATRLDALPTGSLLVVRALPPAATADSVALGVDLDAALARVVR